MTSDIDFIEALSDAGRKEAGAEYLKKLKMAGAKEVARLGLEVAKKNAVPAVGALAAATTAYLLARPGKDGKPSSEQRMARALLESSKRATKKDVEEGRKPNFPQSISRAAAPGISNIADVLAKHPGKAALLAAPVGATTALRILKHLL